MFSILTTNGETNGTWFLYERNHRSDKVIGMGEELIAAEIE